MIPEPTDTLEATLATIREVLGMDATYLADHADGATIEGDGGSSASPPDSRSVAVPVRLPGGGRAKLCCVCPPSRSVSEKELRFLVAQARLIEDHLERIQIDRRLREGPDLEVARARAEARSALAQLDASRAETIVRLSRAIDYRDDETGAHTERVGRNAERLARAAGLYSGFCEQVLIAGPLHDAGKVAIPDAILLKPGRLEPDEMAVIETHAETGYELLRNSTSDVLELAASIARTHHERYDGSGYPQGLVGGDIPLEGRVVAIADVFDALINERVYRPAFPVERAVAIMADESHRFDPELLGLFFERVVPTAHREAV